MELNIIFAQIAGILAWVFLLVSYYKEDLKGLLLFQIIATLLYCVNYTLCGAWGGLLISLFELAKAISYFKSDKDKLIYFVTLPVYAVIAYFTLDFSAFNIALLIGFIGIFASIIDGFGITRSKNAAILCSIISYIMWFVYDFAFESYTCAITDIVLVISNISLMILGYSRLLRINKFHIIKCNYLSRSVIGQINSLDKEVYGEGYEWSDEYAEKVFEKNMDSLLLIKHKKEMVGYINYMAITEKEYEYIYDSKDRINEYVIDDIISFKRRRKNYVLLDSISVEKKYQNYKTIKLIKDRLKKLIHQKYHQGYVITSIISTGVNSFEKDFLEEAGFEVVRDYNEHETLYELSQENIKKLYLTDSYKNKEEKNKYKILKPEAITNDVLYDIGTLDALFYKKKYQWTFAKEKGMFDKNKDSLICVTYRNGLVGYLNYLVVDKELYDKVKAQEEVNKDYRMANVHSFRKNQKNYIIVNSVVIDNNFQDGKVVKMINRKFKKIIKQHNNSGYKIDGIIGTTITKDGQKFLEQNRFTKTKKLDASNYLYVLEGKQLKLYMK